MINVSIMINMNVFIVLISLISKNPKASHIFINILYIILKYYTIKIMDFLFLQLKVETYTCNYLI